jgi:hypothetical protein
MLTRITSTISPIGVDIPTSVQETSTEHTKLQEPLANIVDDLTHIPKHVRWPKRRGFI